MAMASLCPAAMLFVRCSGGIGRNPRDHASIADIDAAIRALAGMVEDLAKVTPS